jgi:hypothetical protein
VAEKRGEREQEGNQSASESVKARKESPGL